MWDSIEHLTFVPSSFVTRRSGLLGQRLPRHHNVQVQRLALPRSDAGRGSPGNNNSFLSLYPRNRVEISIEYYQP